MRAENEKKEVLIKFQSKQHSTHTHSHTVAVAHTHTAANGIHRYEYRCAKVGTLILKKVINQVLYLCIRFNGMGAHIAQTFRVAIRP